MAVYKNSKENNVNKKIKRVVALGIMFSVGVSAFCNGPGLFKDSQSINQKATNDICNMYNYMMKANSDGIISSIEEYFSILSSSLSMIAAIHPPLQPSTPIHKLCS